MRKQVTICDICGKPIDKKTSIMVIRASLEVYDGNSFVAEVHNKCFKDVNITWKKEARRGRRPEVRRGSSKVKSSAKV
jgi:ribosome-binding protein aMBF1 (putative translation factor)